jgi:hypothetical protein
MQMFLATLYSSFFIWKITIFGQKLQFFQLWPCLNSNCASLCKCFLHTLLVDMLRCKMYAKIPCYYLHVIFNLKNLYFWPKIAIFSALTCCKIQLCKFVQVSSSYLIWRYVKVQNECKSSLLLSAYHFLFD